MTISFFKYQGAGNDFILIDNRKNQVKLTTQQIQKLCDRHFGIGADGLILLEHSRIADFKMIYFNADGKQSTMCGNGGRCIVSFAKKLKIIKHHTTFEAIDGIHYAEILKNNIIRLQMQDITNIQILKNAYILNTGSPHYVQFVKNLSSINVYEEGRKIRYSKAFKKEGINVNFVEIKDKNNIIVRTYERGVENETLSCGTGVTASAIATAYQYQLPKGNINISTKGGNLQVEFEKYKSKQYKNIFLIGNAELVFKGKIKVKNL